MSTVTLTSADFSDAIANNDIVVVDFWAEWCGPCRAFAPVFEAASEAHPDVVFGKVDTEAQRELAGAFRIRSIPTLAVFREQILVYMQPGAMRPKGLESLLEQVRGLDMEEVRAQATEGPPPE